MNPSYLGRRAWGRTRGEERLLDPEDVSFGSKRVAHHADAGRLAVVGRLDP